MSDYRDKIVTETIDGLTYTSTKLPATDALMVLPKLIAMVGEPVIKVVVLGKVEDLMQRPDVLAAVVTGIAERADGGAVLELAQRLMRRLKVNRRRGVPGDQGGEVLDHFDDHFAGEYSHLFRVLLFCVKHNFQGPTLGARDTTGADSVSSRAPDSSPESTAGSSPPTSTP